MKVLERKLYQERELPELGIAVCHTVYIHLSYTHRAEKGSKPHLLFSSAPFQSLPGCPVK